MSDYEFQQLIEYWMRRLNEAIPTPADAMATLKEAKEGKIYCE